MSTPAAATEQHLTSSLNESRVFPPPPTFAERAHVPDLATYDRMYRESVEQPEVFWGEQAKGLEWFAPWRAVREGEAQHTKWFVEGKLNLCHNCVDRHAAGARREKVALLWEGEPGEVRRITYGELHVEVQKLANALKALGVQRVPFVAQ